MRKGNARSVLDEVENHGEGRVLVFFFAATSAFVTRHNPDRKRKTPSMLHSAAEEWLASDAMFQEYSASDSVVRLVHDNNDPGDGSTHSSAVLFLAKQANDAIRWLVANTTTSINDTSNNSSSGGNSTNTTGDGGGASASTVLRDTFLVYGTIWGVMLLLFCCVRVKFPRPYTIRRWVDDIKVGFPGPWAHFGLVVGHVALATTLAWAIGRQPSGVDDVRASIV
jgi:hypothetical protein